LRIVVIKKQSLLLLTFALLPVLGLWAAISSDTINMVLNHGYKTVQEMSEDTNNDGHKEIIKIRADLRKESYWVEIVHKDGKNYTLKPDPKIASLGTYKEWYPLNLTVLDINLDGQPEILVMGSGSHEKPFHIFQWDGTDYRLIFARLITGIDFHDVNGDRIPELILIQRIYGSGFEYVAYQWQNDQYELINYSLEASSRGFVEITMLLEYLDRPFESRVTFPPEFIPTVFTDRYSRDSRELNQLTKKFHNTVSIQILCYMGEDLEWGRHRYPENSVWKLQLLLFTKQGTKLKHELVNVEFTTKLVDAQTAAYRIDKIRFK
jgi:hypothetical protein